MNETVSVENSRYVVFCIDTKIKDHSGKIFASHKEAKDFANDLINDNYANKAVIGMFNFSRTDKEMNITLIDTIGWNGDKKEANQLQLFLKRI